MLMYNEETSVNCLDVHYFNYVIIDSKCIVSPETDNLDHVIGTTWYIATCTVYVTVCDLEKSFGFDKTVEITRMWANAQHDGRPPNTGGALCSTPQGLANAHY